MYFSGVVIGLGANLGDCVETLTGAALQVAESGSVLGRSRLYRTAPIGPDQPDFYNAAILLQTQLGPNELLQFLIAVEKTWGRTRDVRWGPRLLDLDILWAGRYCCNEPHLVVPHPRLRERAFALQPLLDLVPDAADGQGPYALCLKDVAGQRCVEVQDVRWPPTPAACSAGVFP